MINLTQSEFQRPNDGYINATKLCTQGGKLIADYLRLSGTKEFLRLLSIDMGIPISGKNGLIQIRKGGKDITLQGTYVHPQVAIDLGQWLSGEFRLLINKWVFDWMSKGTSSTISLELQERSDLRYQLKDEARLELTDQLKADLIEAGDYDNSKVFDAPATKVGDSSFFQSAYSASLHSKLTG